MDAPTGTRGKRKRKKSFIQNAKKYGKKGKFGRGTHVEEDVYQYFVRVLEMSREEFASDDDKVAYISNVFDETVGEEINLSCNQLVSRAIETLLPLASEDVIKRFTEAFSKDLRPIFSDPFASHVIQKLLLIVSKQTKAYLEKQSEEGDGSANRKDDWVVRVGRFALNNIEDFAWDTYANHIIRTVLLCVSGGKESTDEKAGKGGLLTLKCLEELKCEFKLPESYTVLLRDYQHGLCSWPQIGEMAFEGVTSGLLQSLLLALKRAGELKLCDELAKILNTKCFKEYGSDKEELFEYDYSLHLLDCCLGTASPEVYKEIYESCIKGKVAKLAIQAKANFTIQRVFDFCPEKELLEEIFEEVLESDGGMGAIFSSGFFGVLSSIAQACKRLGHKQGVFMQNFMKILDCSEANRQVQFVPLAIQMVAYKEEEEEDAKGGSGEKTRVNLHGSLIIQAMLHFNKPIKVINSLLEMSPPALQELFCDPKGSRIMDAFMASEYVGAKSRERLMKRLMGTYVAMATSKHGSRSLEAAWSQMGLKQRQSVAGELSSRESQITATPIGRIIAKLTLLPLYRRSVEEWKEFQSGQEKKKKIFADIIGIAPTSKAKSESVE